MFLILGHWHRLLGKKKRAKLRGSPALAHLLVLEKLGKDHPTTSLTSIINL